MRVPERLHRRFADERGVMIVLSGLFMVSALTMVAIVVDLGNLRAHRRTIQSEVDFAALAGAERLAYADVLGACQDAVGYLRINTPSLPAGTSIPCERLPLTCDADTDPVAVTDEGTAAPFSVSITYPVDDAAINDPTVPGGIRREDGTPCERIAIRVDRTTQGYFTGIMGIDSMEIHARAVARRLPVEESRIPNLWLLDPHDCTPLEVSGAGSLTVGTSAVAGLITLDSDGTGCGNNRVTVDVGGSAHVLVLPLPPSTDPNGISGEVSLVAMWPAQKNCGDAPPIGNPKACEQVDVNDGRLLPGPTRRPQRATRAVVDHMYDCKASYPNYHGIRIVPCADASLKRPYISDLRSALNSPPLGFRDFKAEFGANSCQNPTVPAELPGNWWVNCNTFRLTGTNAVNFSGGNVVFTGDVDLAGGTLRFNTDNPVPNLPPECLDVVLSCVTQSAASAAFVYLRDGTITATGGGVFNATNTAVIQEKGTNDRGYVNLTGGAPPVWTAPDEGPFTQLALWSEAVSGSYGINGGGSLTLEGVFFTPEARPFVLNGNSPFAPQQAQFVSYRLTISGTGDLTLVPTGSERLRVPPPAALLIR